MSILGRLSSLVKSNVNDLIDQMQDPAKEIDQLVRDMEDSARNARGEVAQVMATEKRLAGTVNKLEEEVAHWEQNAVKAVHAGDDALAKEALRRKAEKEAERAEAEKALAEQKSHVEQLTAGLKALDARVADVKLRQGTLREKARAAKGASPLSGKTSAFAEFDRMSDKVEAIEAEASLTDDLAGRTPESEEAERRLRELGDKDSVDDALAALKKKLTGG
jgi:phage shock protein A